MAATANKAAGAWRRWASNGAAASSTAAATCLLGGALLAQFGIVPPLMAFYLFLAGLPLGCAALVCGVLGSLRGRQPFVTARAQWRAYAGVVFGSFTLVFFGLLLWNASTAPASYDLSTSPDALPRFWSEAQQPTPPLTSYPPRHAGSQLQASQALEPIRLPLETERAYALALRTAEQLDWEVLLTNPTQRRFDALVRSPVFRFRSEVVVQVVPNEGAVVNVRVRSRFGVVLSRFGLSDSRAAAATIRVFAERLKQLPATPG